MKMKTSLITLVLAAGLATVGLGAGASAEAELKKIEQDWLDAYIKSNAEYIKGVEAEDYSVVEPDGTVTSKADDIKSVTDKKFVLKTATMSDFKCRMLGDNAAVVTAMLKLTGTDSGEDISGDFRAIDVFEKKDGKWQSVASQMTKVSLDKK
jgi:ketosteroid isomerase-like protein